MIIESTLPLPNARSGTIKPASRLNVPTAFEALSITMF